ncbi:MAG: hypothetical protein LBB25_00675 [Holosporaceae bacterium]|jgi:hypothetical protein|nr:hypothetical protein [Holosporaceae bacterium]
MTNVKIAEEPNDGKLSRSVLQQSQEGRPSQFRLTEMQKKTIGTIQMEQLDNRNRSTETIAKER